MVCVKVAPSKPGRARHPAEKWMGGPAILRGTGGDQLHERAERGDVRGEVGRLRPCALLVDFRQRWNPWRPPERDVEGDPLHHRPLKQQYLAVQAKIDRAYEDRLSGHVSDDLWHRKTQQWEQELADIRRDTALHESASHDYAAKGSKILELAQTAPAQFVTQNPAEQARMLKMLLSNCTFDRGSLSVAWVKPFDLLARGNENGDWLGRRDSNPNNLLQRQVSYR